MVLLLAALTLVALGSTSGPGGALRSAGAAVFGPVQRAVAGVFGPVRDFFGGLGHDQQARLDQLQKDNDQLQSQLRASDYDRARLAELEKLYGISSLGQYRIVAAQVIAIGPGQGFANTALLDAGTQDGLKVGMTVINGDGLVGRIKLVSASTATVLLAIDPDFNVGARIEHNTELGYVTGQGRGDPMKLTMFDPQAPMAPGDRVVTNQDSAFPGGVPIGTVGQVQGTVGSFSRNATITPFVDFTSLDLVGVIVVPPRVDPRDSVLPPRPTPSPTSSASGSPSASGAPSASPHASASSSPTRSP